MKIVYMSLTGNVKNFVGKLDTQDPLEIISGDEEISEDFVLVSFSPDAGEIPYEIEDFLDVNRQFCKGVAVSGDRAYGDDYTLVAETIADQYEIPIVHRFEFDGTAEDVRIVNEYIN